jgi:N-glycosylase/DNA lyase
MERTINSGQMFMWEKFNNSWYGIYGDHVLKFSILSNNNDKRIEFFSLPEMKHWERKVFRLDDDIKKILSSFSHDMLVSEAIRRYSGLRIMRQDPHQCMLSFVCASNTNIPMIRRMLQNLCRKFGGKVILDGKEFFTFPTISRLNSATMQELLLCSVGYRAKAIKILTANIASESLDINNLIHMGYYQAKEELMKIYGIGNKIADCILLFSLEKLNSFPIDTWIARALSLHYHWLLGQSVKWEKNPNKKIDNSQYEMLSESLRNYFGKYSGYAQQYIYYHMRQAARRNW